MDTYRDCLVCGKSFKVCNTCRNDIDEVYQWRRVVCCPEHFQYHVPIIDYVRGKISKRTAKSDLSSAIEKYGEVEYTEEIKPVVAEILREDKATKNSTDTIVSTKKTKK